MSNWEDLISNKPPDKPATILDEPLKQSMVKKKSIDELVDESVKANEDIWKRLNGIDFYNMGRMYGACDGPDNVSVKDIMDKFSAMIVEMVKDSYIRADKSANKEVINVFMAACKAISSLETMEVSVYKPKLLAALNGFSDSYMKTADPEAVRNISMQQ